MGVLVTAIKAALALVAGLVQQNSVLALVIRLCASINLKMSLIMPTGRFRSTVHKCCFYATNSKPSVFMHLRALLFLGYNIGLKGEIMIKPGTLCMIRGVPQGTCGADCNGKIVVVDKLVTKYDHVIYTFTPELHTTIPFKDIVNSSPPKYLHPLDNPPEDAIDTHSTRKELETQ